jgi:hypothetical protein
VANDCELLMNRVCLTNILYAALLLLALPAFAAGYSTASFSTASDEMREILQSACKIKLHEDIIVEHSRLDFHEISRVSKHCVNVDGKDFCPTFVFSQSDDRCNMVVYTRGNGLSTKFILDNKLRASPLSLHLSSEAKFPFLDLAVSPYRFQSPGGSIIISDTPYFVEIIHRPNTTK